MIKDLTHLTKNEVDAISELKRRLKKDFGEELAEIRLFGSKVRGDFDKESDIDVFVVFDREVDWNFKNKVSCIAYDIDLEFEVLFNLIIFSTTQLKEPKYKILPFIQNVKKEGVKIFWKVSKVLWKNLSVRYRFSSYGCEQGQFLS